MRLSFYGACEEVTGSNFLVEVAGKKILFECGFFQGYKLSEERNYAPFLYDPKTIDAVVVCHAHLDHTGRLPKLVKEGFRGPIFCTAPTKDLAELVLLDAEKLMLEEAERDNHKPLYTQRDVAACMELFECISYGERTEIAENVFLTLKNAGHILGSAVAVLEAEGKKLVYTSDLGNKPARLLPPPEEVDEADYVICETTYGGTAHEVSSRRMEKLNEALNLTINNKGVLMIPTFAIERTQELLHDIEHFCSVEKCISPTFYLDSPLAFKVTKVFEKYREFFNPEVVAGHKDGDILGLGRIKITESVDESKEIDNAPVPKIIIAGSGMMNGGRILFHLQKYIQDPKSSLLVVGYQAVNTLGRKLIDGEKKIKIFNKKYEVLAKVIKIGSYSAHADGPQLYDWISGIHGLKKLFLVHGERNQAEGFSKIVLGLNINVVIPKTGEKYFV